MSENQDESSTPLQRYLARQKAAESSDSPPPAATPTAANEADEALALEGGAPATPPPPGAPPPTGGFRMPAGEAPSLENGAFEPAGFGVRFLAILIDNIIVAMLTAATSFVFGLIFFFMPEGFIYGLAYLLRVVIIFFYYGWFYAERGASPGKMLFHIEVVETGTGRRLGYWRTFFRETLGKFISGLILGIGYFIAFFREDQKALHDLIFDTRVMRKVTTR